MIYLLLFWTFFKVGLFTFGGGYAMIPLIQHEVIENHPWMTVEQFTEFVGIAESTPGPFAINISTFVGSQVAPNGLLGSICSTGGVVLPSIVIILLIAALFRKVTNHWMVRGALSGAKPVVVGLIGAAAFTLLAHTLMPPELGFRWMQFLLAVALFAVAEFCKLGAITLILVGAVLGVVLFGIFGLPL